MNINTEGNDKNLFLLDLSSGQKTSTHTSYALFLFSSQFSSLREDVAA